MDNIILTALTLHKVCRVCLMECDSMFSIYSELFEDNSDETIPRIFEILINISSIKVQSDDGLPSMICTKCIDKAHSSYKFQQQCNRSQALLEAYIEQLEELVRVEEVSEHLELDKYNLNEEEILQNDNEVEENLILSSEYLLIDDLDLPTTDKEAEITKNDDCDDLEGCIPLGEDTVDRLLNDTLQVDNLELISPKIRSFNLDLDTKENIERIPEISDEKPTKEKEINNLNYYQKENENGLVEYECNLCQKTFKFANSLRIHLKNHDKKKPYACSECKKGFKDYGTLMHHIRSHSGEQPYKCKVCGKKYKQSGTLTAHMRIHTGSKPFLCSICGRGFRQAPDLTYHMRTHTKEKPYMCNVCGKTMSMQCHLVQHMRSHTGEKPFKCPECNKAFPSSTRLKRHSITHTTLKPYKCNVCDKSFNRSSSLRVHTKTHFGVRSHICPTCDKSFLWEHSLRGHILTHSKEAGDKKPKSTPKKTTTNTTKTTTKTTTNTAKTTTNTTRTTTNKTTTAESTSIETSPTEADILAMYGDSLIDEASNNNCFALFPSKESTGLNLASDAFQIYSLDSINQDDLETFTLYSAETDAEHTSTIGSAAVQLSAVTL